MASEPKPCGCQTTEDFWDGPGPIDSSNCQYPAALERIAELEAATDKHVYYRKVQKLLERVAELEEQVQKRTDLIARIAARPEETPKGQLDAYILELERELAERENQHNIATVAQANKYRGDLKDKDSAMEALRSQLAAAPTMEQYEELVRSLKERDADLSRRNGIIVDLHKQLAAERERVIEECAKFLYENGWISGADFVRRLAEKP